MNIKQIVSYIVLLFVVPPLLFGCSYGKYAETKQEFSRTESVRMQTMGPVVMEALELILKQLGGNTDPNCTENCGNYLLNHTYYDDQGRKHELKVKDGSSSAMAGLITMQFLPVLERIYKQQQLEMDAPPTAEGIALAGIKILPALATIWGFTDLGGKTGDDNSQINSNNPSTTTNTTTNIETNTSSSSTTNSP